MPIARLIADPVGLETRIARLEAALLEDQNTVDFDVVSNDGDSVLQLESPSMAPNAFRSAIEQHIKPEAGLVSEQEISVPALFVSDMDSTMIGQECIDELADFAGLKDRVADITERAMQGELDFETALRERVGLLAGLNESAIQECLDQRITAMPGARILVQTLRARGCKTALVTGGFHHFADAVAAELGFERVVGNRLAVESGKLTGQLAGPVADSSTKLAVLQDEYSRLDGGTILAAGDGANDIPMLEAADYGIAYKAKPKARASASGWIDSGDLTSVLRLLGVPKAEWVQ